jgi:hypothetical protein
MLLRAKKRLFNPKSPQAVLTDIYYKEKAHGARSAFVEESVRRVSDESNG